MSDIKDYIVKIGLDLYEIEEVENIFPIQKEINSEKLFQYKVPKLSPDGTCSADKGFEDIPYDLKQILNIGAEDNEAQKRLIKLHSLLEGVQQELKTDWIGIYQSAINKSGEPVLVKLAYQGNASRAEFPLTEEFAPFSNNTTVGLSGKAVVIQSVQSHDGAYYKCDGQVNSEACLPIYNKELTEIVGIVDAESFKEDHFDSRNLGLLARLCYQLSDHLPID